MAEERSNVFVGVAMLELHLPEARSLKEKRSHIRGLQERIRQRHQVLVIESSYQNLHQRAAFTVCAISTNPVDLEARLQRVERTVADTWGGYTLGWDVDIIQV
jgi:uncharacterized protein YlxP (DUF503 family)